MIYHNSIDIENRLNSRLVAFATSHKAITVEQQATVNNLQLLALIALIEQQKKTAQK